MSEATTYPHQDLLVEHKIAVTDLPEKTQKKIAKFATTEDAEAKEALDEVIYGEVDDFIEKKAKDAKAAEVKSKVAAHKAKKMDVSSAATAKTPEQIEAEKKAAQTSAPASRGVMKTIFGIK